MTRIGDMEHATCVYHIDAAVAANHNYDWLLFHEMSHQWWGDWVTCGDWRDLWINEGFGTYCEALGMEILYGPYEYHDYVVNDLFQTALTTPESFPIYDPDYYWGATVYEKGACVQHMLRQLLGDTAFFQAWREFGQEHAWGNAVTTDWQAKLEQHYGDSLGWFFGPWVYGRRYPQYHVILEIGDVVNLIIQQQQTTGTYFRMPLEIQMLDADGDTGLFRLWNDAIDEEAWMIMPGDSTYHVRPTAVMLDPFDKVLKTVTYEVRSGVAEPPALPLEFRLTGIYPNPFNAAATLRFDLPRALSVNLTVFDVLARSVSRQCFGPLTAGRHEVRWDGTPFASGVYVFRLETAAGARVAKAVLLK
jgi:aminopeptidase N